MFAIIVSEYVIAYTVASLLALGTIHSPWRPDSVVCVHTGTGDKEERGTLCVWYLN